MILGGAFLVHCHLVLTALLKLFAITPEEGVPWCFWDAGMPRGLLPFLDLRLGSNGLVANLHLGLFVILSSQLLTDPKLGLAGFWSFSAGKLSGL